MNFKRFKHYVVVDEDNKPMSFQWMNNKQTEGQFCYCSNHHCRRPSPILMYEKKEADILIRMSIMYRRRKGFTVGTYNLMPVKP